MAPYVGWNRFRAELDEAIDGLFQKAGDVTIRRLGLRYLNALTPDVHGIQSISDLDLRLAIAGENLSDSVNVNLQKELSSDTQCTVRIATPNFVAGVVPKGTSIVVDVDISTKDVFRTKEAARVKDWVEFAHTNEKEQFFRLLTDETIDALRES
jgi:uncharacterized protein (TIGR04255 family)